MWQSWVLTSTYKTTRNQNPRQHYHINSLENLKSHLYKLIYKLGQDLDIKRVNKSLECVESSDIYEGE
jgi:hypothetical protein